MTPPVAPNSAELAELANAFERESPSVIIEWAVRTYGRRLTLACSFGGPSGMAILDMAMAVDDRVRVHYIDTGLLFEATYAMVDAVGARYGIVPIPVSPALSVDAQAEQFGDALWSRDPDACCKLRKVEPQRAFLKNYDAWMTGIRRDQSATRRNVPIVHWDEQFGLVKINPLAHWTEEQTRAYVREHDVPINPLLERGYASVGCHPCTRAVAAGEDMRAGRWSGSDKIECGLHYQI